MNAPLAQADLITDLRAVLSELERWRGSITAGLAHGRDTHSFNDVVLMVLRQEAFFYSYPDHFYLMEWAAYPQRKSFHCFLAGGDMDAILAHVPDMLAIAAANGADMVTLAGRKGWERVFAVQGWEHVCTTIGKLLPTSGDRKG